MSSDELQRAHEQPLRRVRRRSASPRHAPPPRARGARSTSRANAVASLQRLRQLASDAEHDRPAHEREHDEDHRARPASPCSRSGSAPSAEVGTAPAACSSSDHATDCAALRLGARARGEPLDSCARALLAATRAGASPSSRSALSTSTNGILLLAGTLRRVLDRHRRPAASISISARSRHGRADAGADVEGARVEQACGWQRPSSPHDQVASATSPTYT